VSLPCLKDGSTDDCEAILQETVTGFGTAIEGAIALTPIIYESFSIGMGLARVETPVKIESIESRKMAVFPSSTGHTHHCT
jgi:hypothetical protein